MTEHLIKVTMWLAPSYSNPLWKKKTKTHPQIKQLNRINYHFDNYPPCSADNTGSHLLGRDKPEVSFLGKLYGRNKVIVGDRLLSVSFPAVTIGVDSMLATSGVQELTWTIYSYQKQELLKKKKKT